MIPRGTTPTLTFGFNIVPISTIVVAYLTINQRGKTIIEKELSDAEVGNKVLSWKLTQEETLLIDECATLELQVRYRTTNGYTGQSPIFQEKGERILKDGVI